MNPLGSEGFYNVVKGSDDGQQAETRNPVHLM